MGEEGRWQTAGQARVANTSRWHWQAVRAGPLPLVIGRRDSAKAGLNGSCVIPPWEPSGQTVSYSRTFALEKDFVFPVLFLPEKSRRR